MEKKEILNQKELINVVYIMKEKQFEKKYGILTKDGIYIFDSFMDQRYEE